VIGDLFSVAGCILVGCSAGLFVAWAVIRHFRTAWLLKGQQQERLQHGTWSPVVSPTAWNPPEVPVGRHRSPNGKAVPSPAPQPARPVFHR
jgi:hypothetical protein